MRSISDQFLLVLPALLALVSATLFAAPVTTSVPLVPNIAWVMTLVVALTYPPAWPRWFAFTFGLVQDVLFGTPLGAQAVLTLLLVQLVDWQAMRSLRQRFLVQWLEASGVLLFWHLLLWLALRFVTHDTPPLSMVVVNGMASALWYPLVYAVFTRLLVLLPPLK